MGCYEEWVHQNGFYPNGLLLGEAASVTRFLDPDRWSIAEERTAELIACIQPNQLSEQRRNDVASYVQRLIARCFSCLVFTFGSVPLKTYLPDGDIDLSAFGKNESFKENWADEVRDMLESEEKSEDAEFRVKEVQYIQAEVKIIKCLVENIVVDISFNQLGGLCTLCFLEEVDSLVSQNHLFKRSIILIKAWCYYESRILGAHHGLISTYALETLVLYIFHVFNNSFTGPLEVLYRFLEFFSKFDWENFCVSLWGPVPISSLPDTTADPPRKDDGELLLSKVFLNACNSVYSAFSSGQENKEVPFMSKHFNVIDPLRPNNNLGRSVSKGNFFRIRSAFAFGAQRLAKLLDCPKENIVAEVNQFFMNTLDRHGKGHRPDAPSCDLYGLQSDNFNHIDGFRNLGNSSSSKNVKENSANHESEVEVTHSSHAVLSQKSNRFLKQVLRPNNVSSASHIQNQKTYTNFTSSKVSDQNLQMTHSSTSNENAHVDSGRSSGLDCFGNEIHASNKSARTNSSPELTDTFGEFSYPGKHNRASETAKPQAATRLDHGKSRKSGTEVSPNINTTYATGDLPSSRESSFRRLVDPSIRSDGASNSYHGESGLASMGEDRPVAQAMQMRQEEQDFVNMMASLGVHSFNGHVHMPMNLASGHLPVPVPPSILASSVYAHRNSGGVVPINISSHESLSTVYSSQGLSSMPVSQYFSSKGMASNQEKNVDPIDDNSVPRETYQDSDRGLWSEQDVGSLGAFDVDNANAQKYEENKQFSSVGIPTHPSRASSSESIKARRSFKDNRGFIREILGENSKQQNISGGDMYPAGSKFVPSFRNTSRMEHTLEASLDGSSGKISKSTRDKRGRKSAPSADRSTLYENGCKCDSELVNHVSSKTDKDNEDQIPLSAFGVEVVESTVPGTVYSSLVQTNAIHGYEPAQLSGSNSMLPIAPLLVNSSSRQRTTGNNGLLPYAFYPTGPPVPFVTVFPFYNWPPGTRTSDSSTSHFENGEGFNNSGSSCSDQMLDSTDLHESQIFSCSDSATGATSIAPPVASEERKSDILNSDFASHWQNLQYGRFCQYPGDQGPMLYSPSIVVPPMYTHGQFPQGSPASPLSTNAILFSEITDYGPCVVPVSSLQPDTNRPSSVHRRYGDEVPRNRSGTGTYLPNPKIPFRDRHSSTGRNNRGNYGYDRNDHHGDNREGNWNINSKQRFSGRGRGRNQVEKPNTKIKPDSHSNHSQNNPFSSSNSTHRDDSSNLAYGMYPLPVMNPDGVSSGTALPPVFMLYPCDQNMACSSAEQLEFGSLGAVHFPGRNDVLLGEDSSESINVQRHFLVDSAQSSPDKPCSPKFQS